jgi:AcrR family transcriptional regulator
MRKTKDRAPIWTRPAPGQRRPRLTRDQIAAAALAIADAEGFEAVSMRRIAAELDAGTMTLYYYVRTKEDLVALMNDALMAEVVLPALPKGWRAGLTAIARSTRDVYLRHPWAFRAIAGARMGPNLLRHVEQSLQALADVSLDPEGKRRLLSIVDDYVLGHIMHINEPPLGEDGKALRAMAEFMSEQLKTGEFPQMAALLGGLDTREVQLALADFGSDQVSVQRFEQGLTAMLDGFERMLARRARGSTATRRGRSGRARRRDPA